MNTIKLREIAKPGDIILTGNNSVLSKLIGYGQKPQTKDGKPSRWSHVLLYVGARVIAESTIDFEPYPATNVIKKRRLDNGAQYNYLHNLEDDAYGMLIQLPLTDQQRADVLTKADEIIRSGHLYPISGLIGSLFAYWLFRGWKSNPLNGKGLYCSAFVQEDYLVPSVDFDFDANHTSRNTSPEIISQVDWDRVPELKKWLYEKKEDIWIPLQQQLQS